MDAAVNGGVVLGERAGKGGGEGPGVNGDIDGSAAQPRSMRLAPAPVGGFRGRTPAAAAAAGARARVRMARRCMRQRKIIMGKVKAKASTTPSRAARTGA
eukprot:scaffold23898_cov101-Isochrysis_galbana.AAC.1